MIWPILPYTTPTHPINTQVHEITHIHTNITFQITINTIFYIYTYISYIHNSQNDKKRQKFKIYFSKRQNFAFSCKKYFNMSKSDIILFYNCKFLWKHFKMIVIVLLLSYTYSNYHNSHFGSFRKNIRCF